MPNEQLAEVISMIPVREHKRIVACLLQLIAWMEEQKETFKDQGEVTRVHTLVTQILERMKTAEPASMWEPFEALIETLIGLAGAAAPAGPSEDVQALRVALAATQTEQAKSEAAASALASALDALRQKQIDMEAAASALASELRTALGDLSLANSARDSAARRADTSERMRVQAEEEVRLRAARIPVLEEELRLARESAQTFRLRTEASDQLRGKLSERATTLQSRAEQAESERDQSAARTTELEHELVELRRKVGSHAEDTRAAVGAALALMQSGLSSAIDLLQKPVATPAADLLALKAEIGRRETHLGVLMGNIQGAHDVLEDLARELKETSSSNVQKSVRLETERDRQQRYLDRLQQIQRVCASDLQVLKAQLNALERVARGLPPRLMGAELPPMPALEKSLTASATPATVPAERLATLAEAHGISPNALLVITGFELSPFGGRNLGLPRVIRALAIAGILERFGSTIMQQGGEQGYRPKDVGWDTYMKYAGSPNPGASSMTYRRSDQPLPWQPTQFLSPEDITRFHEAMKKKPERAS